MCEGHLCGGLCGHGLVCHHWSISRLVPVSRSWRRSRHRTSDRPFAPKRGPTPREWRSWSGGPALAVSCIGRARPSARSWQTQRRRPGARPEPLSCFPQSQRRTNPPPISATSCIRTRIAITRSRPASAASTSCTHSDRDVVHSGAHRRRRPDRPRARPARSGGQRLCPRSVRERPPVRSLVVSFGTAVGRMFGTAMSGRSKERPELARRWIPLVAHLPVVP